MAAAFGGPRSSWRVKKMARDYGLGRCCNHDLRRWDTYGGSGAGNSEARRRVFEGQACERRRQIVLDV